MPIYDYECKKCGYTEEMIVPNSEVKENGDCPECGMGKLEQKFSGQIAFDVVGGYDYQYGKKSYVKQSPEQRAKYLVKNEAGRYTNPY